MYTHFYHFEEKKLSENIVPKGEIAQSEQFHIFSTMFSMQFVYQNPLIATFQLSYAASLNLGQSQNAVSGNGLKCRFRSACTEG